MEINNINNYDKSIKEKNIEMYMDFLTKDLFAADVHADGLDNLIGNNSEINEYLKRIRLHIREAMYQIKLIKEKQ